ncbi:MAG: hypothetical protein WBD40_07400 [Tepidisphaeraceae bacterium]
MDGLTIRIEGNINDRLSSMRYLIESLRPLSGSAQGSRMTLDLLKLRYLGPDGVAMIAGAVIEARHRGIDVNVLVGNEPQALVAFVEFSGFNHLVLNAPPPDPRHPENVTVPLRRFDQSRHGDPEPVI